MKTITLGGPADTSLTEELTRLTGVDARRCLQCGKCSGSCPMSFSYDLAVNQVMRLVVEGKREELLNCRSIWLCSSCHTCSSRCPAQVEPSAHMEALRQMARRVGIAADRSSRVFADAFLATLKRNGRMYELEFMMRYNLESGRPFTDADLAPVAISRGKLHIKPPKVAGRDAVARIVERFEKERNA